VPEATQTKLTSFGGTKKNVAGENAQWTLSIRESAMDSLQESSNDRVRSQ
jgi:hypothetical protein